MSTRDELAALRSELARVVAVLRELRAATDGLLTLIDKKGGTPQYAAAQKRAYEALAAASALLGTP